MQVHLSIAVGGRRFKTHTYKLKWLSVSGYDSPSIKVHKDMAIGNKPRHTTLLSAVMVSTLKTIKLLFPLHLMGLFTFFGPEILDVSYSGSLLTLEHLWGQPPPPYI